MSRRASNKRRIRLSPKLPKRKAVDIYPREVFQRGRNEPCPCESGMKYKHPQYTLYSQDVEQVSDQYVVAPGFQRQMSQGVDGQGQHVLAIEGILRMHAHGDSPSVRGDWFFLIIGEFS